MEIPPIVTETLPASALSTMDPPTMGDEKKPEAPPAEPEKKPEAKPDPTGEISARFAALAKKDKALSKRAADLAAQEKAAKDALAKAESENKRFDSIRQKALENPLEAMKELGLTYEQVTEFILNKEKPSANMEIAALRRDLQTIREERERERKESAEKEAKTREEQTNQVIGNFKTSIGEFVQGKAEDYELLNYLDSKGLTNSTELIFRGIQAVHADKGKIPTIKEAADGVQEYFLKEIESLIDSVKHFKSKYGKAETKPGPMVTPDGSVATTTISNSMTPGTSSSSPALTEEQRIARALAAMKAAEGAS